MQIAALGDNAVLYAYFHHALKRNCKIQIKDFLKSIHFGFWLIKIERKTIIKV